jgi:hypothetical protein
VARGGVCTVPAKDGVGFDDMSPFFQGLFIQFLADLGQGLTFRITELYASLDLVA